MINAKNLKNTFNSLWQLLFNRLFIDRSTKKFIQYNQGKWKFSFDSEPDSVVLVGLFDWKPSIYCYSYITNYLAAENNAAIKVFSFQTSTIPNRRLYKIYSSFGATLDLTLSNGKPYIKLAKKLADEVFSLLNSKWDVVNISIENLVIGDLIYDTYLRTLSVPTIDIKDKKLKQTIFRAFVIFYACQDYLSNKKVSAIIPDHNVYINCGILLRLAALQNIPIYLPHHQPKFSLMRLEHSVDVYQNGRKKIHVMRQPYHQYSKIFNQLPIEKEPLRLQARNTLTSLLTGKSTIPYMKNFSAYRDNHSSNKVLKSSDKSKILILLHHFSDAPHIYRSMLFPDFYEWIFFLLERAEKTDFEWYVKPHPGAEIGSDWSLKKPNQLALNDLKRQFKKVNFLDPFVSNQQIIAEGISSLFTVYGTAGHEFAYMGIPVVNAGDNPHIDYHFNIHPKTLSEYESYIYNADSLNLSIDKEEIEEFFYMHNILPKQQPESIQLIDSDFFNIFMDQNSSDALEYLIKNSSDQKEKEINIYLNRFFLEN
jgi:hypothetical protein